MKNLFKFGFFALAISLSVVACNSNNKATDETADSSSMTSTSVDTSSAADSTVMAPDSTAMDTTKAK